MKKTKIVCTMGPSANDAEMMRKLIQNGMDVARFNRMERMKNRRPGWIP